MSTYFAILTQQGEAKIANATALGTVVKFTHMAVGDANGAEPIPVRTQTALVNEVRRAPLNQLSVDPLNPGQIIAEQVLPENVGGWWIREIGIYDEDGVLCAVANCPPSYKPQLVEGSGRTQVIRLVLIVSSTTAVELKIDPAVILATRQYADETVMVAMLAHYAEADPHPQYWNNVRGNAALAYYPRCYSITDLPEEDVGPITVIEAAEIWTWVETPYFTGYRHPLCGRPVDGHTIVPLPMEIDSVGGLLPKLEYARVWGYAQENDRVVSQAFWDANRGGHYFVDVDAVYFRSPDLRDMFRRFTGTDADTANARTMGSRQTGTSIQGGMETAGTTTVLPFFGYDGYEEVAGNALYVPVSGSSTTPRRRHRVRVSNTAYAPRIHA